MISVEWAPILLGFAIGVAMSGVFFAGLAIGMRCALRSENPIRFLVLSAAVRIAALLGMAWIVIEQGGPWAALGYAVAFIVTRFIATTFARSGPAVETAS